MNSLSFLEPFLQDGTLLFFEMQYILLILKSSLILGLMEIRKGHQEKPLLAQEAQVLDLSNSIQFNFICNQGITF